MKVPGRSLEPRSNARPRGMTVLRRATGADKIRLIDPAAKIYLVVRELRTNPARNPDRVVGCPPWLFCQGGASLVVTPVPVEKLALAEMAEKTSRQDSLQSLAAGRIYISGHRFWACFRQNRVFQQARLFTPTR